MQYVMFGNTGMQVSRFCLGAMMFGSKLDFDESQQVVDEALDNGINFIDTADSYGDSEEVLGRILTPEKRERVYLATKVFRRHTRDKRVGRNSRVNIKNQLERSLRLLQTDYVDLYQLHHPDELTPLDETLDTLDTLVREGKIRYWGVSNHYAWQMGYMLGQCNARGLNPLVSLQANYSAIDPQVERETVPFCQRFNIALMCYGPLGGGLLTGKYHDENGAVRVPDNARLSTGSSRQRLENKHITEIVQANREVAAENNLQMNQSAILWLKSKPQATSIILGGSRPGHYSEIYEVADRELPDDAVQKLNDASAPRVCTRFQNQPRRRGFRLQGQKE